jgi:hypothetical protein
MTNTLSIDATEWRVLFHSNISRVNEFVSQNQVLTPEHLKALQEHLDRAKLIASAWCAATPQAVAEPIEAPADVDVTPKRTGGWPKGKPRKRQSPQVVQ